jgi:hypothetical protein
MRGIARRFLRLIKSGFATMKHELSVTAKPRHGPPALQVRSAVRFPHQPFQEVGKKRSFKAKKRGFNPHFLLVS